MGRGFESPGNLTTSNACKYYERAIKDFEDEVSFIQGDTVTSFGHTFELAPI